MDELVQLIRLTWSKLKASSSFSFLLNPKCSSLACHGLESLVVGSLVDIQISDRQNVNNIQIVEIILSVLQINLAWPDLT
jgi:hypothetical protein